MKDEFGMVGAALNDSGHVRSINVSNLDENCIAKRQCLRNRFEEMNIKGRTWREHKRVKRKGEGGLSNKQQM